MSENRTLLQRDRMVVDQKTKLFEMRNQYRIYDEQATLIGSIEQVSQSWFTFIARLGTGLDVTLPVTLEIREADGQAVLVLKKPWFRMTLFVSRPDGSPLGSIRKKIRLGKARFLLSDPAGTEVGTVAAKNWRAKNFAITDLNLQPVAEVTKEWKGLATELFTDADRYAVSLQPGTADPLRSLAVAAALAIDLIMKQKDSG
jgi:uncharacterized protein YxjI